MAKRNAEVVLQYSTLYPFRLCGKDLMCVYCCEEIKDPDAFRCHIDETHETDAYAAFAHLKSYGGKTDYLKVDCVNLKCRLCKEPFDTIAEIAQHLMDRHDNKGIKGMDLNYEVGLHPYRIIKDKLSCVLCDMKQPTLTKLTRHMSTHFATYACDFCDKNYSVIEGLRSHVKFSHSEKHICRKCRMEFSTSEDKKEHMKTSSKCWGYACNFCKERFCSWERKQKHLVSKHNVQAVQYPCSDCGVVFESRANFYYHYNKTHSDLAQMCSHCGQKFGKARSFQEHMQLHNLEKKFKCTVCSKAFSSKKGLRDHMWTHSDKKRYPCMICDMAFRRKPSLTSHMKTRHPE